MKSGHDWRRNWWQSISSCSPSAKRRKRRERIIGTCLRRDALLSFRPQALAPRVERQSFVLVQPAKPDELEDQGVTKAELESRLVDCEATVLHKIDDTFNRVLQGKLEACLQRFGGHIEQQFQQHVHRIEIIEESQQQDQAELHRQRLECLEASMQQLVSTFPSDFDKQAFLQPPAAVLPGLSGIASKVASFGKFMFNPEATPYEPRASEKKVESASSHFLQRASVSGAALVPKAETKPAEENSADNAVVSSDIAQDGSLDPCAALATVMGGYRPEDRVYLLNYASLCIRATCGEASQPKIDDYSESTVKMHGVAKDQSQDRMVTVSMPDDRMLDADTISNYLSSFGPHSIQDLVSIDDQWAWVARFDLTRDAARVLSRTAHSVHVGKGKKARLVELKIKLKSV